ncbi:hypothetical protein B0H19DRAFT_1264557 [Mycena capillaripes]|nr:hypothetical protein B0H19DRAFT_1264557 [Mycena capillaripes]
MHRALELLDIVEIICEQVADQPIFSRYRRELAYLATTCKSFLNPALNALWREQETICNVLKCMPEDLWDISEYNDGDDLHLDISLRRTITSTDWVRPLFYLRRVKSFHLRASFETSHLFEALSLSLPGDYLFPNLEELDWSPEPCYESGTTFHHIRLFLAPHIRKLFLGGIETFTELSILSNLALKRPSLRHVTVHADFPSPVDLPSPWDNATPIMSNFVCSLMHLESLNVPLLDNVALAHLSELPSLTRLTMKSYEPLTSSFQPQADYIPFSALTDLATPTMVGTIALLTKFSGFSLVNLTILSSWIQPTKDVAGRFYSALATHCSRSSLQSIRIFGDHDNPTKLNPNQTHIYSVGGDIIEPLFSFANLVSVALSHPVGFDLDDAIILRMARAWPRIEDLTLEAGPSRHMRSRVTLEGVYAFGMHCPNLEVLGMTFDATVVPKIRSRNGKKRKSQRTLYSLHAAISPISSPGRVAKFLNVIFPQLTEIRTLYEEIFEEQADEDEGDIVVDPEVIASHDSWKNVEHEL